MTTRCAQDELQEILRDWMQATERLQRTHEVLQREIERLRRELASKDRELERRRRLAALGELAAGVAHEVRNPLGAIRLYSGLLKKRCATEPQLRELVEKIEAGIRAIDNVVQDTLALTPGRSDAGRLVPEPRRLGEIVHASADVCRAVFESRGVTLRVEIARPEPVICVDPLAMQRVLVNLLQNAAQVSPPGSAVEVFGRPCGDGVQVCVADRGPGLSEELRERIFDPFFTTRPEGTGLGLTIAHRLVDAHGGTLEARNRAGGGAEFVLTLPDRPATADRPHDDGASSAA